LEGLTVTAGALASGPPGRFTLQAAIAGVHAMAPSLEQTDWPRMVHLYDLLLTVEHPGGRAQPGRRRGVR
jgi:RNA polymerase sigma-70 factor (ECF subfamily)